MTRERIEREFTRKELYDLVWTTPIRTLANELGLSDVALAKACRKGDVPVPERGYWARKSAGKTVTRRSLPLRFPGADDEITIGKQFHSYSANWRQDILDAVIPPEPTFDETMEEVTKRVERLVGRVPYLRNFDSADPLISKLLAHDDERREKCAKYDWSIDRPIYESGVERRRLLILNSLFLAFRRSRCVPDIGTSKYVTDSPDGRSVTVRVGSRWVSFRVEPQKNKRPPSKRGKVAERLRLTLGSSHRPVNPERHWEDGDDGRIESHLREIVIAVIVAAEQAYRDGLVWSREHLIEQKAEVELWCERERQAAELKAQQEREREEMRRVAQLLRQAANLNRAQTIRGYVRTVIAKMADKNEIPEGLEAWSQRALAQADRIDPTKNGAIVDAIGQLAQGVQ